MIDTAATAAIQTQLNHDRYINLVSFVILYYDYALTLSSEVDRFWSSKSLTWASSFFYINRYLSLFGHIPIIVQDFWDFRLPKAREICFSFATFHEYFAVAVQLVVGILLTMRIHALYERDVRVLLFICACGLAVIVFGTWSVVAGRGSKDHVKPLSVSCMPPTDSADAKRFAAAWTGVLLFDSLIFSMTVHKSFRQSRQGDRPLLNILLRDGAIYFGIMAIAGLANIISLHLSPEYERGFTTTFANIISSTMISRLMLNLRDPKLSARYSEARVATELRFNPCSDGSDATTTINLEPI